MFSYTWQIFGCPYTFSHCKFCGFSFGFHSNSLQVKPQVLPIVFIYTYVMVSTIVLLVYPAKLGKCSNFSHACFQMG